VFDEQACTFVDEKVWTTGALEGVSGSVVVTILHGATGAIEHEIPVPELPVGGYGPYGAAFDPDGDYWFVMSGNDGPGRALVRVDAEDLFYEVWDTPADFAAYGFTIDTRGRPWIVSSHMGGLVRFDPDTGVFDRVPDRLGIGMQEDDEGRVWIVGYPWGSPAVYAYDRDTMQLVDTIATPGVGSGRGLSLDYFGKILVVGSATVGRIDPETGDIATYDGLDSAYTYSDMTGWALKNVTFPPEG
jgi:streptogramin lyase